MSTAPARVHLTVDTSAVDAWLAELQKGRDAATRAWLTHQRRVAGREARYYVRGGLSPQLDTLEALNAEVQKMLGARWFWGNRDAALFAASLIRGWVEA